MKTFKIMMAIAVAIFATTSLIVSLTSPIKSLLDVNVKALTQDEGGTGGIGGGEGSVIAYYGRMAHMRLNAQSITWILLVI